MLKQFEWDLGFLKGYEEDYSDGSENQSRKRQLSRIYTNMELEKIYLNSKSFQRVVKLQEASKYQHSLRRNFGLR